MKKLLVLLLFVSSTCFSQVKYPLKKFPIHSSIWNAEVYNQDPSLVFLSPKGETNFEYNSAYLNKMDMSIVNSYLKTSFDNFRLSYGYKVRPVNKSLSALCAEDAKKLKTNKGKYANNDPKATPLMAVLLDNGNKEFGFGISYDKPSGGFNIVVKSKTKKGS